MKFLDDRVINKFGINSTFLVYSRLYIDFQKYLIIADKSFIITKAYNSKK